MVSSLEFVDLPQPEARGLGLHCLFHHAEKAEGNLKIAKTGNMVE
jgi:hypothetical protein